MNNLLFTALAIALIYYLFFYRPTPKTANRPEQHNKAVQTEPEENKEELITSLKQDIQQKEQTIIGLNNSYAKLETKQEQELASLNQDLSDSKKAQQKLLETVNADEKLLATLLKEMKELTQQLG